MSKEAFYFSHDSNARNDEKILELRDQYGWEGYGMYWAIVEMLRDSSDYSLNNSIAMLKQCLNIDKTVIAQFYNSCLELGLFIEKDNRFYSESLMKRMEKIDEKRRKRADAGRKGGNAKAMLQQCSGNALAKPSKESKEKEIKIKEIKIKENKESKSTELNFDLVVSNFNNICVDFPKLVTISKARKDKIKLRLDEITKAGLTFNEILYKMQSSNFLKGINDKGWKASFDWLIENDKNWLKVIEGNYNNREPIQVQKENYLQHNQRVASQVINELKQEQKDKGNGVFTNPY